MNRAGCGMPHPKSSAEEQRRKFVRAVLAKRDSFTSLCGQFRYSRPTGYKWLRRFEREGLAGLQDRRSGPQKARPSQPRERWKESILAQRRAAAWGPKKLRRALQMKHPRAKLPSERTISRLLVAEGYIGLREVRSRPGPELPRPPRREAHRSNDIWTIDFKGYFLTGDGSRCDALTVRDLHSRRLLLIEHVPGQREQGVRAALIRCFRRYGLPAALRVDNGSPFGNRGPRGLSRLSVWWLRLGIAVEFTRPAHPQDNGAHEQMHRELKAQTANPPAATLRAQAARFTWFLRWYNEQRPHEALGLRTPAHYYVRSRRAYRPPPPLRYGAGWEQRRVMVGGRIYWRGRVRVIGRAFQRELIGLKAKEGAGRPAGEVMEVYLGQLLLGELHAHDPGGLRTVRWREPQPKHARTKG